MLPQCALPQCLRITIPSLVSTTLKYCFVSHFITTIKTKIPPHWLSARKGDSVLIDVLTFFGFSFFFFFFQCVLSWLSLIFLTELWVFIIGLYNVLCFTDIILVNSTCVNHCLPCNEKQWLKLSFVSDVECQVSILLFKLSLTRITVT